MSFYDDEEYYGDDERNEVEVDEEEEIDEEEEEALRELEVDERGHVRNQRDLDVDEED